MDARKFFEAVALMRDLQKEYFKTRDTAALARSKAAERTVDTEIERVISLLGMERPSLKEGELFKA